MIVSKTTQTIDLEGADVRLTESFLDTWTAERLLNDAVAKVPWRTSDRVRVFGKWHQVPRSHCWFSDVGPYMWSALRLDPVPWLPFLDKLRRLVCDATGHEWQACLANMYANGSQKVGWHSDDEPFDGVRYPRIAVVTVGAERDMKFRPVGGGPSVTVRLPHGSLLTMDAVTQARWQHCVPTRASVTTSRVSLTFRGWD